MQVDTIVAIATPTGRGGVGIVRISGPKSLFLAKILSKQSLLKPRHAYHTTFYADNDEAIDEGLLIYFQAPNSFTGEDVVEFQCHGSPIVLDNLVKLCITKGARMAHPGEFSQRAFLNDKIDLTQAEAIADLIAANSTKAAHMAMRSLQGEFSKQIHILSDMFIELRLYVEAAIDFPEEEIDFLTDGHVALQLEQLQQKITTLINIATQGVLLREGITIVIAGRPNVGKSTLMNALAGRDIAIVTPIAGTTRDVIREHIIIDDITFKFIDTAGLHYSDDIVELEGIKRAWNEIKQADCILLVADFNADISVDKLKKEVLMEIPQSIPIIVVYNKIDQSLLIPDNYENNIYISAKSGQGLFFLKEKIKTVAGYQPTEGLFLARRRHLEALETAKNLLINGIRQLTQHRAGELLAEDLRQAHINVSTITGEFSSDDLLGAIFSSFCIGK